MKHRFVKIMALTLAAAAMLTTAALAATEPGMTVRVNGIVTVCKESSPYVDDTGTVFLPLSFVKKLGGKVKADTMKGDVPYVAEQTVEKALKAVVDYSDTTKTVGIYYGGRLTDEQIVMLQSLPYTQPEGATTYAQARQKYKTDRLTYYYGADRNSFGTFANAREHLYHTMSRRGEYNFPVLGKKLKDSDTDTFYQTVVEEAMKELAYTSPRLAIEYLADTSCIYQSDSMDRITCTVRGIARVKLATAPQNLTGAETAKLCKLGFTKLSRGVTISIPVDVHMHTQASQAVTIHTVKAAGEQF